MKKILMALLICLAVFTLFSCKNEVKEPVDPPSAPSGEYVTFKLTEDSYDETCEYWIEEFEIDPSDIPSYEEFLALEYEYDGVVLASITAKFYRNGAYVITADGAPTETGEYIIDEDHSLIVDGEYWIGDFSPDGQLLLFGDVIILEKI